MGSILGLFIGLGLISSAWSGELESWGIGLFIVLAVLGIFIFPRTIGTFATAIMFLGAIAIIAALINGNSDSALTAFGITLSAAITQFIVGKVRPEST